jgi:3-deoxy-manno-octulosonate cytidylyltransferase (CMP-KDO synthetase)
MRASGVDEVLVATDDRRIEDICKKYDMKCTLTDGDCPTGVDRAAEVAAKTDSNVYLLVQGDEPCIETKFIEKMCAIIRNDTDVSYVRTFRTAIHNPVDVVNMTVIKIVTAKDNSVLFASRSPIPYPKGNVSFCYYKSVGIYAYPREILLQYPKFSKGVLELAEDHDFMRLLENGVMIKAFPVDSETISVDTLKDLERVKEVLKNDEFACKKC